MATPIRHNFFFPHPIEAVWEYLTKPGLLEQWLMKNDFEPVVGHHFQFRTNPIPSMDFDGVFHCQVLEIIPFEKLVYSWKGGTGNGDFSLDTEVVWTLVPTEGGTNLFLEHSGFGKTEHANFFPGMTDGWRSNVQKIVNLLNNSKQ